MTTVTDLRHEQQEHKEQQRQHDTRTIPARTAATALSVLTIAIALTLPLTVEAAVYEVSPEGEPYSLTAALATAGPGDTIYLADGIYREPIVTVVAGEEGNPVVIEGGSDAVISAFSGDRDLMWSQKVVDVRHSWITLRGFTVDGHLDSKEEEESFVDKCIWVEGLGEPTAQTYLGSTVETSLIGFVMDGMTIMNCGMECVRLRNWVTNSVITDNVIEDCGIYDYRFRFDGKIGEAVYVGTSSNQWTDGPDGSNYNLISGNMLRPRGNECVDVKEGASFNVIENNICVDQRDPESGCYDSRGNRNTFRYNSGEQCTGAGIRLGGHVVDGFTYGVDNDVYGNHFKTTGVGSIKARRDPQGIVCGNTCDEDSGDCEVDEEGEDDEIKTSWNAECPKTFPAVPFIDADTKCIPPAVSTSTSGLTYLGCFIDKGNADRIMHYMLEDGDMTTELCEKVCEDYKFFGTQYGRECWCGDDGTDHLQHGESEECNYECEGNADEICGGIWCMSVYKY